MSETHFLSTLPNLSKIFSDTVNKSHRCALLLPGLLLRLQRTQVGELAGPGGRGLHHPGGRTQGVEESQAVLGGEGFSPMQCMQKISHLLATHWLFLQYLLVKWSNLGQTLVEILCRISLS